MRVRYYNSDIKRFINQDIKVGDIGSSQSLNRYAYCEGNPVSLVDPFGLSPESTQDQGKESKYAFWHAVLDVAGIFFDGADLINTGLYLAEKDYVNAAISLACGIPAVGNVVTGVAKASKAVKAIKTAAKITDACKTAAKIGNTVAGAKALYDSYQAAQKECKTTGGKIAYMAGTVLSGYLFGKAANWGANKLKNLASKAMPKLKTAVQEGVGKLFGKVNKAFGSFKNKCGSSKSDLASYYEYKALKQQGYNASEAYDLMKQFRSGMNPNNEFVFHFTSMKGGKGITDSGGINGASVLSVAGQGVYAGTTPTPSWALKHIPYSGWGLGKTPVRIPIRVTIDMSIRKPIIPMKSAVIKTDYLELKE